MTDSTPTLRTLFEIPADDDPNRLPDGWKPFREKLGEEVKGIKWKASMPDLTVKIAELLDLDVPTLLVATWKKATEVKTKLAESRAKPDDIIFAADLPKTRSGKIMRRLLRDIAEGKTLGDTTTLADPSVVARLREQYQEEA